VEEVSVPFESLEQRFLKAFEFAKQNSGNLCITDAALEAWRACGGTSGSKSTTPPTPLIPEVPIAEQLAHATSVDWEKEIADIGQEKPSGIAAPYIDVKPHLAANGRWHAKCGGMVQRLENLTVGFNRCMGFVYNVAGCRTDVTASLRMDPVYINEVLSGYKVRVPQAVRYMPENADLNGVVK